MEGLESILFAPDHGDALYGRLRWQAFLTLRKRNKKERDRGATKKETPLFFPFLCSGECHFFFSSCRVFLVPRFSCSSSRAWVISGPANGMSEAPISRDFNLPLTRGPIRGLERIFNVALRESFSYEFKRRVLPAFLSSATSHCAWDSESPDTSTSVCTRGQCQ